MKKKVRWGATALLALLLTAGLALSGCAGEPYVTSVCQTGTDGTDTIYTVYYSDGSTTTFTATNGADGSALTIADVYEKYCREYGEISYEEFLDKYLTVNTDSSALIVQGILRSSVTVYSEFAVTQIGMFGFSTGISLGIGSGVVYRIEDEYTYLVTNYHVVYNENANKDNGSNIGRKIYCYLYGSESTPVSTGSRDEQGYLVYDYGVYAIECEYVGGTINNDLAVLRAKTEDVRAINPDVQAVRTAEDYSVGETAIAIGNTEGQGISVTQGIVSVDSETIDLELGGITRSYRLLRIDTAIYGGNSGGGLFNMNGELIGITNAGNTQEQNINYAIPVQTVRGTVENILYFFNDGISTTTGLNKPALGVTVTEENARYVYDATRGSGSICADIVVDSIEGGSLAEQWALQEGDRLVALIIRGTEYPLDRAYEISDLLLLARPGDALQMQIERAGETLLTDEYRLTSGDFRSVS